MPVRAVLSIIFLFAAAPAQACQCGGWPTVAEAAKAATRVFEGEVVAKSPVLASSRGYWFVVERWTFAVDRSWKGSESRVVVTEGYSNCSKVYALGQKAIVYAYPHEARPEELEAHKCGEPRGESAQQLKALGTPRRVFAQIPRHESAAGRSFRHFKVYALMALAVSHNAILATWESPGSSTGLLIISAGVLLSLQVLALFIVRRQRVKIALLLLFTVFVLVSGSFFVASRQLGGYFGHLIENECPACPVG